MIAWCRELPAHARNMAILLLAVVLLVLLYLLAALGGWFVEHNQRINDLEPRIARLQGYTLSVDTLRESARVVNAQLADYAYPASGDSATTGAAVQQQLRGYLETAGFSVSGSQLLAPKGHENYEEIRVNLSGSGPMEALDQVLIDLQKVRPLLLVRSINLAPMRTRRGDDSQTITVSLSVSAVRLLP